MDTIPVTDIIWQRLKQFVPDLFPKEKDEMGYEPVGLNERLRFLRYDAGDFFAGHCDGAFSRDGKDGQPD